MNIRNNNYNRLWFDQKLILNQWLLSMFEAASFEDLTDRLKLDDGLHRTRVKSN